jgi:hypothetical protein
VLKSAVPPGIVDRERQRDHKTADRCRRIHLVSMEMGLVDAAALRAAMVGL